jgi:ribosomal protein L11 methyltransferase
MSDRGKASLSQPVAPFPLGRRFLVIPAGTASPPDPARLPLYIEAGGVFGSGAHPTTQLCLRALERHLPPGTPLADIGAGTGILAIAAARLDAGPILAVDTDPEAVRVAQANVQANHVAAQVTVQHGSVAEVLAARWGAQPRAWVVANILAHVIDALFAQGLAGAVGPGGWLILSGLMRAQTPAIRAHLQKEGLVFLAQEQQDEWVCLLASRG